MSVFDPKDYEPLPVLKSSEIKQALEEGQYRPVKKKKWYQLRPIVELSEQDESEGEDVEVLDARS